MTKKYWIWTTIILAVIHGIVLSLITPYADDVLWSRFDGNPYGAFWNRPLLIFFFLLYIPYYLFTFFLPGPGSSVILHVILLIGNSLVWGSFGAFLISFLPFMKVFESPDQSD